MFAPPFCPHRDCPQHDASDRCFFVRHGFYQPRCRPQPVPRYRCKTCGRTFSRQTFRMDYRDHRPDLNEKLFDKITDGSGIRNASRKLGLSLRCTELKLRKIARHLRRLNLNLSRPLSGLVELQFDEFESFEANRSLRPVTVPVLLERTSRFLVWFETGRLRPKGKMTAGRIRRIQQEEDRFGKRRDGSKRVCRRTLLRGRALLADGARVVLHTDEKSTYPRIAGLAFAGHEFVHETTNSRVARRTWNRLFPINHEEERLRDKLGRMRRQSWQNTKKRRYLELSMHVHAAYRNLVLPRFNTDKETPAQMLGFVHRRMTHWDLLGWAQRWGKRSPHPLSPRRLSVAEYERRIDSRG